MKIVRPIVQECFIPAQYTSSPEIIKSCLQEVLSEGMIDSQVSAPADNEDMTKKKRENIIKKHAVIIAYYEEQEQTNKRKKITLRTLYPEWFAYKWQDTNNSNYMSYIDNDWKRYYENDPIVDRPVIDFTTLELKNWARNKIITGKLTKKQYYNMAIIIRQSLEYLVELGELPCNHFAKFKINSSLFTPVIPKEAEQEVFTEAEEQKVKELAAAEFEKHPNRTTALAVLVNFSLGLRIGELVALKWKDLKELFDRIKEANLRNGYTCDAEDYIFMYRKHRLTGNSVDSHYERYCKQIGISKKGNHKVRKTALTKVADNPNINLKDAMQFAGHRDVKTFINHYCFSRYSDEQKRKELEKSLGV